ncbi:hypothetical protein CRENBAI_000514 [Crenichthys baileyi]|uniref:Uncharacterized protein n=1 Tax=Crenichthys baileyi TaxID=28760 RepID=A0AAV9S715_9TELE
MARSKQLNTIENAVLYNNDLESADEELPGGHHPTFCPSHISNPNIPPSATTTTQSTTSISTRSSAADSNPSASIELCEDEPTAHASSNYTTYLSVMSNVSDLSSDDEEMNHAILASFETHLSETSSKSLPVTVILEELSKNINTAMHCKFNRELLRLLIEALSMSPMFEGTDESKHLSMNSTAMREDKYFLAGRAIAVSLVHGGPAPRFFSPVLFASLVGGPKVSESSTLAELLRATDPLLDYMTNAGCVRP